MPVMTPRLVSQGHPAAGVAAPREPPSPHTYTTDGPELPINNSKRDPEPKGTGHHTMAIPQGRHFFLDCGELGEKGGSALRFLSRMLLPAQVLC